MDKSTRLRLDDIRRVFRLLGDCRDLGHDRAAWMPRAVAGLRDEFAAYLAVGTFIEGTILESLRPGRSLFDLGYESARDREAWLGLLRSGRNEVYGTVHALYRQPASVVVVRSRDQLVPDREWLRSVERNEDRMSLHQDETLLGQYWHGAPGTHIVISINHVAGERKFDGRQRAFLRLFLREIHELAGSALTMDEAGPFAGLTPRAREILNALLEGDAEKQIAARLGVSRHTVHDYVKALYRRFGVASRGEMLAFYYRSSRPPETRQ
jgi:DNA-binding CsgD family transcriptional regulator